MSINNTNPEDQQPVTETLPQKFPQSIAESSLKTQPTWFVYLVRMGNGALYAGISTDPARRLRQHQGELAGGAKALRGKGPLVLSWQQATQDRMSASRLEYWLKTLKKSEKEALIAGNLRMPSLSLASSQIEPMTQPQVE